MVDTDHAHVLSLVRSALHSEGWQTLDPLGTAIATKAFKTVNVEDTALAFLSRGDGYNRMLSFEFNSEGRNQTAADCALIPLDANEGQVRDLVVAASRQAHKHILNSFGVRMA
jgi:hypothetical protein